MKPICLKGFVMGIGGGAEDIPIPLHGVSRVAASFGTISRSE